MLKLPVVHLINILDPEPTQPIVLLLLDEDVYSDVNSKNNTTGDRSTSHRPEKFQTRNERQE